MFLVCEGTVFDLKFADNNNLISCSSDASIRVWDLTTLNNNTTFTSVNTQHQGKIKFWLLNNNIHYS